MSFLCVFSSKNVFTFTLKSCRRGNAYLLRKRSSGIFGRKGRNILWIRDFHDVLYFITGSQKKKVFFALYFEHPKDSSRTSYVRHLSIKGRILRINYCKQRMRKSVSVPLVSFSRDIKRSDSEFYFLQNSVNHIKVICFLSMCFLLNYFLN